MGEMTFMVDELMPDGRYVLLRRRTVAHIGAILDIAQHWKPGDIVCVNQATFDHLLSPRTPKIEESAT